MAAAGPGPEPPAGHGDLHGGLWSPWGAQPALLPRVPGPFPALHCYGWLPPTAHSQLFAQPVSTPRDPFVSRQLLLPPGPLLCAPLFTPSGAVEEPSRARAAAAASRESTAALKAWLCRHRKNPYPSKGEKLLLALVSRLSLAQVSTWFANARRRLRKEGRAGGCPSPERAPQQPSPRPRIWRVAELATGVPPPAERAPEAGGRRRRRSRTSPGPAAQAEKRAAGFRCTCGRPEEPGSRDGQEEIG